MQRLAFHWKIIINILLGILVVVFFIQFPPVSTVIAISLGLLLVNASRPALFISSTTHTSYYGRIQVVSGEEVAIRELHFMTHVR